MYVLKSLLDCNTNSYVYMYLIELRRIISESPINDDFFNIFISDEILVKKIIILLKTLTHVFISISALGSPILSTNDKYSFEYFG